jgi:hypothetical protein
LDIILTAAWWFIMPLFLCLHISVLSAYVVGAIGVAGTVETVFTPN